MTMPPCFADVRNTWLLILCLLRHPLPILFPFSSLPSTFPPPALSISSRTHQSVSVRSAADEGVCSAEQRAVGGEAQHGTVCFCARVCVCTIACVRGKGGEGEQEGEWESAAGEVAGSGSACDCMIRMCRGVYVCTNAEFRAHLHLQTSRVLLAHSLSPCSDTCLSLPPTPILTTCLISQECNPVERSVRSQALFNAADAPLPLPVCV